MARDLFISPFSSDSFHFMYFETQLLGAFTFTASLLMMGTCFIYLSKATKCTTPRMN